MGWFSIINSVTNISRLGTFKVSISWSILAKSQGSPPPLPPWQNLQYLRIFRCLLTCDGCKDEILFFFLFFLRWAGPRPHIPYSPDLILSVNLVAMGPVHLSPVTWPQAFTVLVFPYSADAYSRTTASYRLTQLFRPNTRE
jgi:hypothetical protein